MNTLLAIITAPQDNERLARNWPYLTLPRWDVLGAGTAAGKCEWPKAPRFFLNTGQIGKRRTPAGDSIFGLVRQELDIWKFFLEHDEYDSVCVQEADSIFTRIPPEHPGEGLYLVTALPNYAPPGVFKTPVYASTPRWGDRKCIERLWQHGWKMLTAGDHEHWISDRFPMWICHKHHLPWLAQPAWSPCAFAWDGDWKQCWVRDARAAIKMGAYSLHSVKEAWQLEAVKDLLTPL